MTGPDPWPRQLARHERQQKLHDDAEQRARGEIGAVAGEQEAGDQRGQEDA